MKRGITLASMVLMASVLLAPADLGAQTRDETVIYALQSDVQNWDPPNSVLRESIILGYNVFDHLAARDLKTGKVGPSLAVSWKNLDDTTWEVKLRKGVKFHDGSPFTADDVVFSFGRLKQPQGTMQIYVANIAEVKKVDDYTVDFMLSGPHPVLLQNISDFRIMSKSWSEKNRSQNIQDYKSKEETYASRNTNGTGPYLIKGWEPDKRIVMMVNKEWWGKLDGNVTDVIYTPIKSDATRVSALLSGEVDLVTDLPTQDVERLRKEPALKILDGHEVRTIFIGLDQHNDELKYA
ncbi:MAG: ABC transporter substrate-binding protein, partial [Candidatus Rokuibacteriota bacterium]